MLAFCRELDVQYKTAFVLAHKLREAMASSIKALRIGGEAKDAPRKSTELISAVMSGHKILPSIGSTGGLLKTNRVSARLWSRCASAGVER